MSNVTVIRGKGPRPEQEPRRGPKARIEEQLDRLGSSTPNVGMSERHASLALGGAMGALALTSRRPIIGGLFATLSAMLLSRGATGHCPVYEHLGVETCQGETPCAEEMQGSEERNEHRDIVDEASEESMIASDAPSHTPTTGTGAV